MITMRYINLKWEKIVYLLFIIEKYFIDIRGRLIRGLQNLFAACEIKYFGFIDG